MIETVKFFSLGLICFAEVYLSSAFSIFSASSRIYSLGFRSFSIESNTKLLMHDGGWCYRKCSELFESLQKTNVVSPLPSTVVDLYLNTSTESKIGEYQTLFVLVAGCLSIAIKRSDHLLFYSKKKLSNIYFDYDWLMKRNFYV